MDAEIDWKPTELVVNIGASADLPWSRESRLRTSLLKAVEFGWGASGGEQSCSVRGQTFGQSSVPGGASYVLGRKMAIDAGIKMH